MWKIVVGVVVGIVALLILVQLAVPPIAAKVARDVLGSAPGYDAAVDGVELHPLRGEAAIRGVVLSRTGGAIEAPFVSIDRIRVRPVLGALLRGHRIVDVAVDGLEVNVVIGASEAETQAEIDADWVVEQIDRLPSTVDRLTVRDGRFVYRDLAASPDVVLTIHELEVDGSNLANRAGSEAPLFGSIEVRGRVMESGSLTAEVDVDPYADAPTFALEVALSDLDLREVNDALRAYGQFDVEAGTLAVTTSIRAEGGRYSGAASPVVSGLEVLDIDEDGGGNPLKLAWEAVVGIAADVAEAVTPGKDQISVDVPIQGEFGEAPAALQVLRVLPNAWFGALTRAAGVGVAAGNEAVEAATGVGDAVEAEQADTPASEKREAREARREERREERSEEQR